MTYLNLVLNSTNCICCSNYVAIAQVAKKTDKISFFLVNIFVSAFIRCVVVIFFIFFFRFVFVLCMCVIVSSRCVLYISLYGVCVVYVFDLYMAGRNANSSVLPRAMIEEKLVHFDLVRVRHISYTYASDRISNCTNCLVCFSFICCCCCCRCCCCYYCCCCCGCCCCERKVTILLS